MGFLSTLTTIKHSVDRTHRLYDAAMRDRDAHRASELSRKLKEQEVRLANAKAHERLENMRTQTAAANRKAAKEKRDRFWGVRPAKPKPRVKPRSKSKSKSKSKRK